MRVEEHWAAIQASVAGAGIPAGMPVAGGPGPVALPALPSRSLPRRTLGLVTWLLAAVLVTAAVALIGARAMGIQPLAVLTGSMQPTIAVGDLVLVQPIVPTEAAVGDVVTFDHPTQAGVTMTHRVTQIDREGDELAFVTRGDANRTGETWRVKADGRIGRHLATIPKAGRLTTVIGSSALRGITLALSTLIALATVLWWVWRPASGPERV